MMDYFHHSIDYPEPTEILMREGVLQCYLSSTFLNGWINYVEPIAIRLITRDDYKGNVKRVERWNSNQFPDYHSKLSYFQDDILILAIPGKRGSVRSGKYWFFWFSCDTSDCQIGRFNTTDTEEQVVNNFISYADSVSKDLSVESSSLFPVPSLEIDPKFLSGWISF